MIQDEVASDSTPDARALLVAALLVLQRSGLFDGAWFLARNPDLATPDGDPLHHFHCYGWRENRWPNAYFDPAWYLARNGDVRDGDWNPLLHYVLHGEAEGRQPIEYFDPDWYRAHHAVPSGTLALAHFLQHRASGTVSPIPEFDAAHYLRLYPDVGTAGMDPFEHYLVQGAAEDRSPSKAFDPVFYRARYLREKPGTLALLHYRRNRYVPGIHPCRPVSESDIPAQVRHNTQPGALFEDRKALLPGLRLRAKVLAFYLPQFHAVPENDAWWGTGFTEWTNVARALPRFVGHYQPRIPRDLGHYSLHGTGVLRRQAEMARGGGIHGFVFYLYSFNGRRLLDGPLEALLADPSIDLPFCLMWANENWTRRWDGSEHEVLVSQDYRTADEPALIEMFMRHFSDPRYIRLEGRPVLMVYRAGLIPKGAVARWRRLFRAAGEDPMFVMAQSFDDRDPRLLDMDAAVEFPPHKLTVGQDPIPDLAMLDHAATVRVLRYDDVAAAADLSPQPFPLIRTALPGWDNDARRQGAGMTLHGATPAAYQAWLERLVAAAQAQPVGGEALVCVNAWNEWGEGAYLEPDVHFGAAFLNATGRAVAGLDTSASRARLLLVGHDAFPAGAQLLLLHLGRQLQAAQGVEVAFLLLGDGALLPDYQAVAPTIVLHGSDDLGRQAAMLESRGFQAALVNSCAAAGAVGVLAGAGVSCTLLVHELPRLLAERGLGQAVQDAVIAARHVVFSTPVVRDAFAAVAEVPGEKAETITQGLYNPVPPGCRAARRNGLGVGRALLAVGIGYGDLRKGFDLFLHAWRAAQRAATPVHFLWAGDIDAVVRTYLGGEIGAAVASGTFHLRPFAPDGAEWLAAADVHLLTSREDPMPSVVLEAMSAGTPTIAFEGTGGAPGLLAECRAGTCVPLADTAAMAACIGTTARAFTPARRARLSRMARKRFDFSAYAHRLLALARPGTLDVSVVVLSYNYGHFLQARLQTVFAQTHPVSELIVLDDASTDGSEGVARQAAAAAGRVMRWEGAARNGGSVFRQWRRAAAAACGEWLWIAEADDESEPGFLQALAEAVEVAPDVVMAFTDSRAIDDAGRLIRADHQAYYAESGAALLARDGVFPAAEMLRQCLAQRNLILNVSAVVFRRTALLAALERCGDTLDDFTMAGDWRLYAELLQGGGRVAYVARPLNVHRRHAESVTHSLSAVRHLDEVARMHVYMQGALGKSPGLVREQRRALRAAQVALSQPSLDRPTRH